MRGFTVLRPTLLTLSSGVAGKFLGAGVQFAGVTQEASGFKDVAGNMKIEGTTVRGQSFLLCLLLRPDSRNF